MSRLNGAMNGTLPHAHEGEEPRRKPAKKQKRKPAPTKPEVLVDRWKTKRTDEDKQDARTNALIRMQETIDSPMVLLAGLLRLASHVAFDIRYSHSRGCGCIRCVRTEGLEDVFEAFPAWDLSPISEVIDQQAKLLEPVVKDRLERVRRTVKTGDTVTDELALLAWISSSMWPTKEDAKKPVRTPVKLPVEIKTPRVAL